MPPTLAFEQQYSGMIAGVDEAGRGPWAGPVVASAVILTANTKLTGIDDSKKLTARQRDALFDIISSTAHVGVGQASVEEIDSMNILAATMLAMQRAVAALPKAADVALIDGNKAPDLSCQTVTIIEGDAKSLSIAAASIIAKVTRDRIMQALAIQYPEYGFDRHSGYGTKMHEAAIDQFGVTEHHRKSYAPIKRRLLKHVV